MQLPELLAEVDSLKAEIDRLRPLQPEVEQRIMQKFRLDWNYHSNAIEGNSLTIGETKAFLTEGLTANGKPLRDHLDIKGHNDLINALQGFIQQDVDLTEALIRQMHKILLGEAYQVDAETSVGQKIKDWVYPGEYKTKPNFVNMPGGERHQYTVPQDVPLKMHELLKWFREEREKKDLHPVVQAAVFHHQFLAIHPFQDGNGRLGRILLNLILMRIGFPPVIFRLSERNDYIASLRRADANENQGVIEFVARNVVSSESIYLRGARGESIEDADDIDKSVALLKQELSHRPPVVPLSKAVQSNHIENHLIPFINRLHSKMSMYDELFSEYGVVLTINGLHISNPVPIPKITEQISSYMNATDVIAVIGFRLIWRGFTKDGTNDFSLEYNISIFYEARKFRIEIDALSFSKSLLYPDWLSEDECKSIISRFAQRVYDDITSRIKKRSQPI